MTQETSAPRGLAQWQSGLLTDSAPSLTTQAAGLLKVYQHNRYHALLACMNAVYVHTRRVLGDDIFYKIMPLYLRSAPLTTLNLNTYGDDFSTWLKNNSEYLMNLDETFTTHLLSEHYSLIVDLSQAEWHCHNLYYASDEAEFDFAAYAKLTQNQASDVLLYASRHLILMSSYYDLSKVMQGETLDDARDNAYHKQSEPMYFCIVREQYHGKLFKIEYQQYGLLKKLKQGLSINQIVTNDEFSHQLECISPWIAQGWIREFNMNRSTNV